MWFVGVDIERASLASVRKVVAQRREALAIAERALAELEAERARRAVWLPSGHVVHARGVCGPGCTHEPTNDDEVKVARAWLRKHAQRRVKLNRTVDSYFLKAFAEAEAGTYVANGAMIEAAALEGYLVVPTGRGPSAYFNAGFARGALR